MKEYKELYLNDAMVNLANAFDYAINVCKMDPVFFSKIFVQTGIAEQYERCNPTYVAGKSGEELVKSIIERVFPDESYPSYIPPTFRTPEYWAGWALVQYQFKTSKRFKDIFERVPLINILSMYKIYHEMDISQFIDALNQKINNVLLDTNLKKIREASGLSQNELSKVSDVSLRSIQLYEQRVNDIDKAQVHTLYKLSRALGCNIEDLLENPEELM
ncbi:MAG: helix-turn-helix transcriptional regulator [Anaeroplasma bactoclasticum]|nr:helix-turn-helix transcriptional regulator [Anaeroplasma bactoclasticum]